jgi:hypothetical protein
MSVSSFAASEMYSSGRSIDRRLVTRDMPQDGTSPSSGYHHAPMKVNTAENVGHGWRDGLVYSRPGERSIFDDFSSLISHFSSAPLLCLLTLPGPLPLKGHGTYEDQLIPREHEEFRSPRAGGAAHVGDSILDPEEALELCRAGWAVAQVIILISGCRWASLPVLVIARSTQRHPACRLPP